MAGPARTRGPLSFRAARFKSKTIIARAPGEVMSSKKQLRSLHDKRTKQKFGLSRHYREIGIKAVAGATRKQQTRDSMGINRKRTIQKEDTMNEDSANRIA